LWFANTPRQIPRPAGESAGLRDDFFMIGHHIPRSRKARDLGHPALGGDHLYPAHSQRARMNGPPAANGAGQGRATRRGAPFWRRRIWARWAKPERIARGRPSRG
jgi:hypothetical protein